MWKKSVQQICKKRKYTTNMKKIYNKYEKKNIYNKYVKNIYHKNKKFIQYIQPRNKYKQGRTL